MLDAYDLNRQMPEGEGTRIHLKTLAVGEITVTVDRSDPPIGAIPGIGAEVYVYESWDALMFSESMANFPGKERLSMAFTIVDNDRL